MSVDVSTAITIDRPRDDVADVAADPVRAPDWYANIRAVDLLTAPPHAIGSRFTFHAGFLGRDLTYTYEVVDLAPGEHLVMRTADGPFPMETTYTWTDAGHGRTRMTLRNRGEPAGFSRALTPFLAPAIRHATTQDLRRLKSLLESQQRDAGSVPSPGSSRRLLRAVAALVGLDAVGGLVAIAGGINEPREAWGSTARLAAPWPMILVQIGLTAAALGSRRGVAVTASGVLSLACALSAASGFFDGGLTDDRLLRRHSAFQAVLVGWTALVGVLAAGHGRRVLRR